MITREAMLSATQRWYRIGMGAGTRDGERMRARGPLAIAMAAGLVMLGAAAGWPVMSSLLRPNSTVTSDSSPVWLLLDGQASLRGLLSEINGCIDIGACNLAALSGDSSALASLLDRIAQLTPEEPASERPRDQIREAADVLSETAAILATAQPDDAMLSRLGQTSRELEPLGNAVIEVTDIVRRSTLEASRHPDLNLRLVLLLGSAACLLVAIGFVLHQRLSLKRELNAVKEAEAAWRHATLEVFDSLPVPILVIGDDQSVLYTNRAVRELEGSGEVADVAELARRVRRSVESQSPNASGTYDFPLFAVDGSVRHVTVAASPFYLLGDVAQTYVIADNTLLRDAELRALNAGKLTVLGELSSAVAHELNQPLAVIKAAAANGRNQAMRLPEASRIADKFTRIDDQVERARRIIENVRRLGRPAQSGTTTFSVYQTLRSTFGLVSQQYKLSSISLDTNVNLGEELKVVGEATLFEIAILNILLNARDALNSNSSREAPAVVRVRACRMDNSIHITISDNAGGIPDALLPRIFDSFVSSKSPDAGTGLGLSIARRAIEGMGGSISARNLDDGAVFSIDLPIFHQERE